jgi:hypothetical protein
VEKMFTGQNKKGLVILTLTSDIVNTGARESSLRSRMMITEKVDILLEKKIQMYYELLSLLSYRKNVLHYICVAGGGGGAVYGWPPLK